MCSIGTHSIGVPCSSDARTAMAIACDENGIDANEDFHFPFIAGCPEDNERHEKINAEPGNIH